MSTSPVSSDIPLLLDHWKSIARYVEPHQGDDQVQRAVLHNDSTVVIRRNHLLYTRWAEGIEAVMAGVVHAAIHGWDGIEITTMSPGFAQKVWTYAREINRPTSGFDPKVADYGAAENLINAMMQMVELNKPFMSPDHPSLLLLEIQNQHPPPHRGNAYRIPGRFSKTEPANS